MSKLDKAFDAAISATKKTSSRRYFNRYEDDVLDVLRREYDFEVHSLGYSNRMALAVNVKVRNPVGSRTKAVLKHFNVPGNLQDDIIESTFDSVREQWWEDWTSEGGFDQIKEVFGRYVDGKPRNKIYSEGRSGGYLIFDVTSEQLENVFIKEPAKGRPYFDPKVIRQYEKLVKMIEESASDKSIDDMLAGQLEVDLQEGQLPSKAQNWWQATHGKKGLEI